MMNTCPAIILTIYINFKKIDEIFLYLLEKRVYKRMTAQFNIIVVFTLLLFASPELSMDMYKKKRVKIFYRYFIDSCILCDAICGTR